MPRSICTALIQMDVRPAPTGDRLFRADALLQDAAQLGMELAVLPEMFNTGYAYTDENFQRAEPFEGATVTWMRHIARRLHIHLAGTLLLLENGEIYNAMLIVSPGGQTWRYDKSYPWGWERGYYRENRVFGEERITVAQTDLGNLGMLVCWDVAHPELWQHYAGKIDMMVISSCPPNITDPTFLFPPEVQLTAGQLGPIWASLKKDSYRVFGDMIDAQAAWLGVPVAHSLACGQFESPVPAGHSTLLGMLASAPWLARYLPHAGQMRIRAEMVDAARVISADGKTLARLPQSKGESFILAETPLPDSPPPPAASQPPATASRISYWISDSYLPKVMRSTYEQGLQPIRARGNT